MPNGSSPGAERKTASELAISARALDVDDRLLDRVITSLRALSRGVRLQYALQVGALLLDSFWSGNPENYRDKQKPAGTGFGALLQERAEQLDDLQLSPSTLRTYIRSTIVWRQLPAHVRERLDLPNLQVLTLLPDADQRGKLAAEAVQANLTTRQLETRVAQARQQLRKGAARGRKPVPEPLKHWRRVCNDAAKSDIAKMSAVAAAMSPKDRAEMRNRIQTAQANLSQLLALMTEAGPATGVVGGAKPGSFAVVP